MFNPGNQALPENGDLVALRNGAGGYIGGVSRKDKLQIVNHCKEWEHLYFETVDNGGRFALRQKVSNHYIGGSENVGNQLFLSPSRNMSEIFTYNLLPNGMVAIINVRNSRLGKNNTRAIWSNENTLSESWSFEMIQKSNNTSSGGVSNASYTGFNMNSGFINPMSTATLGLIPPPGSVVAIQSTNGSFIGKFRGLN